MNIKPLAKILVKRPKTVLLMFTIVTILIGTQVSNIYMESDLTKYLPEDDPTIQLWREIDREFQIGNTIIILVDQTDRVYDIRDPKVLLEMDEVIRAINPNTYDDGEIDGIFSVRSISNLIKEENSKPSVPGGLGGTGNNEIPDDKNLISIAIDTDKSLRNNGVLTYYDDSGSIGRRYARMDEIGTPFCITVDHVTLQDNTVTIRDRDTTTQDRKHLDELVSYIKRQIVT